MTLVEIGQVLRHRDLATTALYAKVDWPRCGRRPALAGSAAMSALAEAARDYLRLRNVWATSWPNTTGAAPVRRLPGRRRSAHRHRRCGAGVGAGPDVDPAEHGGPRRMTIARGFARYLAGIDPRTECRRPGWSPAAPLASAVHLSAPTTSPR